MTANGERACGWVDRRLAASVPSDAAIEAAMKAYRQKYFAHGDPTLSDWSNILRAAYAIDGPRASPDAPSGPWKAQPSNATQPWRVWCKGRKVLSDFSREEALAVRDALNRLASSRTEGK